MSAKCYGLIHKLSFLDFIEYNPYFKNHPNINKSLLPYLRFCIAKKECRKYCIGFNTKMFQEMGADKAILCDICSNISKLSFDEKQKLLLTKVIYAIYNADKFSMDDLEELYSVGFSDKDFYELLGYGTNFMAKSKMIEVYLK